MWGGSRIRGRGRRAIWDGNICVHGNRILEAKTVAFDSPADGIVGQSDTRIEFRSRTTGDPDGIEVLLETPNQGSIELETPLGRLEAAIPALNHEGVLERLGGLDLQASICRYPEAPERLTRTLALECSWRPIPGQTTPLFIKATQVDGHMAWSSPVYVNVSDDSV